MKAVVMLISIRAKVALPIRWISRCPAVMFAVSRTARAIGWMNKLIVSIITSIGIRGNGVPWGRKCARDALVLWRNPRITAPAQRGIAMPRFIDNWVVGVNEWGNSPIKFVDPINIISDVSIRAQVWPFLVWIIIICFVTRRIIHFSIVIRRLLARRFVDGKKIPGNIMIITTIGRPISVGVMKEANRFSFILFLRGLCVFGF